jgi:uncharacterized coiled-coil protein SlyX
VTLSEAVDVALRVAGALGLAALLLWFVRQRRQDRAEALVAERTVGANVTRADAGALEAHVVAVEHAFEVERASKDREIAALTRQVAEAEGRCTRRVEDLEELVAQKDGIIGTLRTELATVTDRMAEVTRELNALRERLEGDLR